MIGGNNLQGYEATNEITVFLMLLQTIFYCSNISTHWLTLTYLYLQKSGPGLFPVRELLQLLLRVTSVSPSKIQQLATTALVEVANSVNGDPGCGKISTEGINVILDSLKSTCTATRESALKVCINDFVPNLAFILSYIGKMISL